MLVTEAIGGQVMEDSPTHEAMRKASISRDMELIEGAKTADGFEKALLGFGYQFNTPVAVYSKDRCLHVLMERDGMSREDALEYFDFNVAGAWVGEGMPVFLD
jgi:hypothetical protein